MKKIGGDPLSADFVVFLFDRFNSSFGVVVVVVVVVVRAGKMGQNPCKHLIENSKKELTEEEFKALLERYDTSL